MRISSATVSQPPISSQHSPQVPLVPTHPSFPSHQGRNASLIPPALEQAPSTPARSCQIPAVLLCLQELQVLKKNVVAVVGIVLSFSPLFIFSARFLPPPRPAFPYPGIMSYAPNSPHTPGSASSFVYNSAGQNLAHHHDSRNPMSSSQISWLAGLSTSFDAPTDEQKYLRKVSSWTAGDITGARFESFAALTLRSRRRSSAPSDPRSTTSRPSSRSLTLV